MAENIQYAVLNFDVHGDPSIYSLIYRHIGPHGIRHYGSQSSCLINYAHKARLEEVMSKVNEEAKGKAARVTWRIRRLHPDEAGEVREDSIRALKDLCAQIVQSLLERIDRVEKAFNEKADDVNKYVDKKAAVIREARKRLDEARGLTMIFLVENEIADAVKAAQAVIDAQAALHGEFKAQHHDEIAAARKAKREMEARS